MGSSSSKKTENSIHATHSCEINRMQSGVNSKSDSAKYNTNIPRTQPIYNRDYLHGQVNNPFTIRDSYRPFNDLSKIDTIKQSNGLPKSVSNPSQSNDLSKSATIRPSIGSSKSVTNNPNDTMLNIKHTTNSDPKVHNDCGKDKCKGCNGYHASKLDTLNTHCPMLSKIDHKDTINVQSKFHASTKEDYYNLKKHQICTENIRSTNIPAISLQMLTKDDFMTMWFSWKNEFLKYMWSIDQGGNNKEKWGIMLLNRLGPFGQEIYRTFTFDDGQSNDNIDILLEKFDQYCTFGKKKRMDEDVDIYVNNLKVMVSKYTTNVDEIVKKKILNEIDVNKFTNIAKTLIPEFSFSRGENLSVQEVTYIWMRYENVNFAHNEKIVNNFVKNCSKCSLDHPINICRAYGKQCSKCGNMNHHWTRCPSQFKENCSYCGASHFYRQCPAYMNECSKCHKLHHFYWMCGVTKVLNCRYCGLSHIAFKSECPAINAICVNCKERGHFLHKCWKKK